MPSSSAWPLAGSSEPRAPVPLPALIVLLIRSCSCGVLLEVLGLEVVVPQHGEVVLREAGALVDDDLGARLEQRVVVRLGLLLHGEHGGRLDAGLGGVVHAAGQVAVGADDGRGGQEAEHGVSSRRGSWPVSDTSPVTSRPAPRDRRSSTGPPCCPTLRTGDCLLVRLRRPRPARRPRGRAGRWRSRSCWSSSGRSSPRRVRPWRCRERQRRGPRAGLDRRATPTSLGPGAAALLAAAQARG